jgi:hypothetical protein
VHVLVRDTMIADLSHLRRTRMHARVAVAIHKRRPDDLPALAYHYVRAASSETAALAIDYSVRAAELAERRYAHDAAVELLEGALDAADRRPIADADHIALLGQLLRAQIRAGAVAAAVVTRDRAVDVALRAGDDDLLVAAFTAWTEPTPWQTHPYGTPNQRAIDLLTRLLRRDDLALVTRCRLLDALSKELDGEPDPRAAATGAEVLQIARRVGDPALVAMALTADARGHRYDIEADARDRIAAELRELSATHDLVAYQWSAEHIAATVAGARNDVAAVRRHIDRMLALAEAYELSEPRAVGLCARAMLAHVAGRFDDAERLYGEATALMLRHGSLHAAGFQTLALVTVRASQGRLADLAPAVGGLYRDYGPLAADALAVVLARNGQIAEAKALRQELLPLRADYFFTTFATLRGMAVVALDERDRAAELVETLAPLRDQLAGAVSTALALRPVAYTLGELCALLGRPARDHFGLAVEVASRWGAAHWVAEAQAALAGSAR